ncbi:hypothetical protein BGU93_18760, partial [Clostridioides difficile]
LRGWGLGEGREASVTRGHTGPDVCRGGAAIAELPRSNRVALAKFRQAPVAPRAVIYPRNVGVIWSDRACVGPMPTDKILFQC